MYICSLQNKKHLTHMKEREILDFRGPFLWYTEIEIY